MRRGEPRRRPVTKNTFPNHHTRLIRLLRDSTTVLGIASRVCSPLASPSTSSALLTKQRSPALVELHHNKRDHSREPEEDVSKDATDCSAVRPAEDGVEDLPAVGVEVVLGVAAVQVPNVAADVVRTGAVTGCSGVIDVSAEAAESQVSQAKGRWRRRGRTGG